jgi:hypothetical protein
MVRQKARIRHNILNPILYLRLASVEFAVYVRRRACSCSALLQMLCNAADAVKSTLARLRL